MARGNNFRARKLMFKWLKEKSWTRLRRHPNMLIEHPRKNVEGI